MPAPHALCSKMLAERTASRNVLVLFYFIHLRRHALTLRWAFPLLPLPAGTTLVLRKRNNESTTVASRARDSVLPAAGPGASACLSTWSHSTAVRRRHTAHLRGASSAPQYTHRRICFIRVTASSCPCRAGCLMYWRAKRMENGTPRPLRSTILPAVPLSFQDAAMSIRAEQLRHLEHIRLGHSRSTPLARRSLTWPT